MQLCGLDPPVPRRTAPWAESLSFQRNLSAATEEYARAVQLEPKRADLRDEYGSLLAHTLPE